MGHSHGSTASPIVAHIQHQYTRFHFGHLRLGRITAGRLADVPRLAMVLAIDDAGTGNTVGTDELTGKDQGTVHHRDTTSRTLKQEIPFGRLHLAGDVDRFGPRLAVVIALHQHQLGSLFQRHALPRIVPGTGIAHTVCPSCHNPDGTCLLVHQDGRIAHTVLCFGQPAIFAKAHGYLHLLPRLSAVGTAAKADFDVFLEVHTAVVTYVIDCQQRPFITCHQARNAIGSHPVVSSLTNPKAHPMDTRTVEQFQRSSLPVNFDGRYRGRKLGKQRCLRFHLQADPEIIDTRIE